MTLRRLLPTSGDLVDIPAVAGLGLMALLGFGNTFEGSRYLVVGGIALGLGIALAYLMTALRQPMLVLAAATLVAYFVAGAFLLRPGAPLALGTYRLIGADAVLS